MDIYFNDQQSNFDKLLTRLISKPVMKFDKSKLKEKTTIIDLADKSLTDVNLDFFFDYQIFPTHIMTHLTQWKSEKRTIRVNDTILQQAFIPPTRNFSQKIVFGVRINRIIDEETKKGFSYETIEGHAERGESTFTIEQKGKGRIFKIKTFSEPGNFLSQMVAPLFTIPYQTYCTRAALENVKRQMG